MVLLGAQAKPQAAEAPAAGSPDALVRAAQRALSAEEYAEAERLLTEAQRLMPGEASLPYNLGVARYRQGDYAGAAKAFTRAAELANDANLRARAAFNQGTSTYAEALKSLEEGEATGAIEEPLKQSIDLVGSSLEQLKSAIEAGPNDRDARANAELAHRLLRQLEQLQQQLQQQPQQQQQDQDQERDQEQQQEQSQSQDQQDPQQQQEQQQQQSQQQQEQEQSEQQQSQRQQPEQQQRGTGEEEEEQQQAQSSDEEGDEEEEQQPEPQAGDDEQEQDEAQADEQSPPREGQPREGQMSREQAERLLQMVRDKQRERRAALAAQRAATHKPAVRDW